MTKPPLQSAREAETGLGLAEIARLWWPLGASWLLMGLELPLFAAAVARLPDATVHLAAHGGVVFPIALVVEAPIMMFLAASTALAGDRESYRLIRRFMMLAGAALTLLHLLIAFTPLFDVVASRLLGSPAEIRESARLGLRIMLPWTWSIAFRRFHQGLLIRAGRSRPVALGTAVRLVANVTILGLATAHGGLPGIAVGTAGIAAGVMAEAAFIGACARPVVRALRATEPVGQPLDAPAFVHFYAPLALTQVLSLAVPPLCAAAISRMPQALPSLAAWPAAMGLSFLLRSPAFAFHEVAVALLGRPGAVRALGRFAAMLGLVTGLVAILVGLTPLGPAWLAGVSALPVDLASLAQLAVLCAALQPPLAALEHWYQGALVRARRTRVVTGGTLVALVSMAVTLGLGVALSPLAGILNAMLALSLAAALKVAWLRSRARAELDALRAVEAAA